MSADLRRDGDGFVLRRGGGDWSIRPGTPGGWELRAPGGDPVAWMGSVEQCVEHVRGGAR